MDVTDLINKLIRICSSSDLSKNIYADLNLKELLADPSNSVGHVCLQCGFNDVNYFIGVFKKTEGITPGVYQLVCQK